MTFTITFKYSTGKIDVEYKEFDDIHGAEYWAEKECVKRNAKEWYIT